MNLMELIVQMLSGQQPSDQSRRDAGISVLPPVGGIQDTGKLTDLRRRITEAYKMGDYETAERLQAMFQAMNMPQPMNTPQSMTLQ